MQKIILIPAYEPDDKLIRLVKEFTKEDVELVVVDDGSGDNYKDIFKQVKEYAHVISYPKNKGKGHALKTGIKYIKDKYKKEYVITTVDSDGQHKVSDALKLSDLAITNPNTLILGKRIRNKNTPLRSKIGNGITMLVFRFTAGYKVYDTQTGLRSLSYELVDYMLSMKGNRYEYEMNVLLNLKKQHIKVLEEEIETIYIDNNSGSHFNTLTDSVRIYKDIIKFAISSLSSFLIDYVLYIIFLFIFKNPAVSNIGARIISATYNYNINKIFVFRNKNKNSLIEYILLACIILVLNTFILECLIHLGLNEYLSKVITEIILFIFSYLMQMEFIFRKKVIDE